MRHTAAKVGGLFQVFGLLEQQTTMSVDVTINCYELFLNHQPAGLMVKFDFLSRLLALRWAARLTVVTEGITVQSALFSWIHRAVVRSGKLKKQGRETSVCFVHQRQSVSSISYNGRYWY